MAVKGQEEEDLHFSLADVVTEAVVVDNTSSAAAGGAAVDTCAYEKEHALALPHDGRDDALLVDHSDPLASRYNLVVLSHHNLDARLPVVLAHRT